MFFKTTKLNKFFLAVSEIVCWPELFLLLFFENPSTLIASSTCVRFGNELIFLFAPSLLQLLEGSLILSYYFCFNCTSTGADYLYTFVKHPR